MEKVIFHGWPNCLRLSNEEIELIITTDVGPRVIRLGFINEDNEFKEFSEELGITGGDTWHSYGGHRLWHSPEDNIRTYFPDNSPVAFREDSGWMKLTQQIETTTGIQKEIDIRLFSQENHVRVVHRLINKNLWPVELAAWALSVMAPGGKAILPLPPRGKHGETLLPSNSLSLWAYTDLSDPRWTFGEKYILLQQDPGASHPQKIGASVPDSWIGYARAGHLFIKKSKFIEGQSYPDFGCSMETFTNDQILEVESLSPFIAVPPGDAIEHIEDWYLFKDVPEPENDDDVIKYVIPKVKETEK